MPTCRLGGEKGAPRLPKDAVGWGWPRTGTPAAASEARSRSPRRTFNGRLCSTEHIFPGATPPLRSSHIYLTKLTSTEGGIVSLAHRHLSGTQRWIPPGAPEATHVTFACSCHQIPGTPPAPKIEAGVGICQQHTPYGVSQGNT